MEDKMGNGFLTSVKVVLSVASIALLMADQAAEAKFNQSVNSNHIKYKLSEILIKLKNQNSANGFAAHGLLSDLSEKFDVSMNRLSDESLVLIRAENGTSMEQLREQAAQNSQVEYAEPNYVYYITDILDTASDPVIPNDPKFNLDWGLLNNGQADSDGHKGKSGSDIGATKAWAISKGVRDIKVAVIDTGVDYNHEELKENIMINTKETSGNGIDDDGNGFIDDVRGWNFNAKNNNPMDDNEHGTHVSGTIGAKGNNAVGTAGVVWNVQILPVKFLSSEGSGTLADAVEAINYATKMGVNVMNNSWGGGGYSKTMYNAIKDARDKGILFVAAAGNEYNNNDNEKAYPASYDLENVISVAATDNRDKLATFSNYGVKSVHLAAPGVNIFSSIPTDKGGYDTFSGTSMACPHVVGAAALLWSVNPGFDYKQIKNRLMATVDLVSGLSTKVMSGGRLNVYNALVNKTSKKVKIPKKWKFDKVTIESEHPYKNDAKLDPIKLTHAGAKMIRVHFQKVATEKSFDIITIKDANGDLVDEVSGVLSGYSTNYFEGDTLYVGFNSDGVGVNFGFAIDKIEYLD